MAATIKRTRRAENSSSGSEPGKAETRRHSCVEQRPTTTAPFGAEPSAATAAEASLGRSRLQNRASNTDARARITQLQRAFEQELWGAHRWPAARARIVHKLKRIWLRLYAPCRRAILAAAPPDMAARAWNKLDSATLRKLLKTTVALAIALLVGWGPVQRLMQTTSVEAIVNARLVTLRAPIDGEIAAAPNSLSLGATVSPTVPLMKIVNRRADRARLDDLRRSIGQLEDERAVIDAKLDSARALHAGFVAQTRQFQDGRVRQLEARAAEIKSELAAARAKREETAAVLQRTAALESRGAQTRAALDRAQRENEIAVQTIAAGEQRLKALEVELQAARTGFFLGDSYNDKPRSAQRADELQQQIAELDAELRQREIRLTRLNAELAEETSRYNDLAEASIATPTNGSVWEVLTAPGEEVRRGQELARLLDCSSAVVTATVAESVYNRLRVGQPARFRFREGGAELEGRVVHLTGMAAAPANFAITPSALIRESYRVTVAVPALSASPTCNLGRTGRVVFAEGSGTSTAIPPLAR
jgi:multidrug resistance efflux pump